MTYARFIDVPPRPATRGRWRENGSTDGIELEPAAVRSEMGAANRLMFPGRNIS
jgi:hypothetical protein